MERACPIANRNQCREDIFDNYDPENWDGKELCMVQSVKYGQSNCELPSHNKSG